MTDISEYLKEIASYQNEILSYGREPEEAFFDILNAAGYKVKNGIIHDVITRVDGPEDKPGKASGWYFYTEFPSEHDDGIVYGVGSYGSWKTGEKVSWSSIPSNSMNAFERQYYYAKNERIKLAHEAEKIKVYEEKSLLASEIWEKGKECNTKIDHPYLERKRVKPYSGLRISINGDLIIPVCYEKKITSIQFIKPDGEKKFLSGGRVKGCYFRIKGNSDIVYIVEGYATGASIAEATGNTVFVCFNAGNLYEVAAWAKKDFADSRIIIAADDDRYGLTNVGRTKATQAAEGLDIEVVFPDFDEADRVQKPTDFNDYMCLYGLDELKKSLCRIDSVEVYSEPQISREKTIVPPKGILKDLYDFYNATDGNTQKGFALQTALAIGSIVCSRSYKTNKNNFSSLFFLNIGKSGTGKEHVKNVIEQVLMESGYLSLVGGDGYTSTGAVFTQLLMSPRHITVIDEFGRYLEVAKAKNNSIQKASLTTIMEMFGRCHTVARPQGYSGMTMKEDMRKLLKDRMIYNPAITLVAMSTPSTFFENLSSMAVYDGFLNRFIINISDAEPDIRKHKDFLEVPDNIKLWVRRIHERAGAANHIPNEAPKIITLMFAEEAYKRQEDFQRELLVLRQKFTSIGLEEMANRANEIAMRISLISALARDYSTNIINIEDVDFGIEYVKACLLRTVSELNMNLSNSEHEADKKAVLRALRRASPEGILFRDMGEIKPFSKHSNKKLCEFLDELVESGLAEMVRAPNPKGKGGPLKKYYAIQKNN